MADQWLVKCKACGHEYKSMAFDPVCQCGKRHSNVGVEWLRNLTLEKKIAKRRRSRT